MNKRMSIVISAVVFAVMLICSSFSAFAMGPTDDGVYEVSIEMWHAEKERTSMGDSYISHTALLMVDGDSKTLTVAPNETSSDMQFWYYKDGSVQGETVEVAQKNNVEIAGTTYQTAFEFPINSSNEFVGVKFAASAMPLSPSARIKIDYGSAKKIGDVQKETTTQVITTQTTTQTTVEATQSEISSSNVASNSTKSKTPIIIGVVCGVIVIGVVVVVIVKKKSN